MDSIHSFFNQTADSGWSVPSWEDGPWAHFHILSDLAIFAVCIALPAVLIYYVRKRWEILPYAWVFYSFVAFILLCGISQLLDAFVFWLPIYRLNSILLVITALVSIITLIGIIKVLPKMLALKGPMELQRLVDEKTSELELLNRKLERTVRARTTQMREAQAVAGLGSWKMNLVTKEVTWSEELYRIFGIADTFKPDYSSYLDLMEDSEKKRLSEAVKTTLETGEPFHLIHRYLHPDGKIRYIKSFGKLVAKNGQPSRLIGTGQDVTRDQLLQESVIENELLMRSLLGSATAAIIVCDKNGTVLKWNSAAEHIFGWNEQEMMDRSIELLIPDKHLTEDRSGIRSYRNSGDPNELARVVEIEGIKKDGSVFPMELSLGGWQIDGKYFFCGIMRDIGERRNAEKELIKLKEELEARVESRTSELLDANLRLENEKGESMKAQVELNRLAAIVQESDDSIISLTPEGILTSWNSGAERLYGYKDTEAIGKSLAFVCPDGGQHEFENIIGRVNQGMSIENYETERITKEGSIVPIAISYSPLRNDNGDIIGISGIARNITEQKNAEREQQRLIRKLEATNKELESFAYITSHDLKAPLRAIGSLSDWIYTDHAHAMGAEGKEQLELLKGRVQRMHDLIDGILQYSRIGRKDGQMQPIDLNNVLHEVLKFIEIPEHVTIDLQHDLPTVVMHKTHPTQIFENLITNAIKYGKEENALITIAMDELPGLWKFSVKDNGPGIDKRYHDKIFDIFQTLNARDSIESTGIGLTIVKKIVERAGGQVWVESELGNGTTFFFTLPKS